MSLDERYLQISHLTKCIFGREIFIAAALYPAGALDRDDCHVTASLVANSITARC